MSVSGARTGDALAGVLLACLAGFYEVERSGVVGRHRARRLGAVPPLLATSAARWGLRVGAGPTVSGAECNVVKSRRVRRCVPGGRPRVASSAVACHDLADEVKATGEQELATLGRRGWFPVLGAFERVAMAEREPAFMLSLWRAGFVCPERATEPPTGDAGPAHAANQTERANAKPTAATTGDEDETEGDDRTQPRTARATKHDGNRTQRPDTATAANERRPGTANA